MLLQEMLQGLFGLLGPQPGLLFLLFLPLCLVSIKCLLLLTQFGQGTRVDKVRTGKDTA